MEVLAGEKLDEAKAGTRGQTLERSAGIQGASFGPGIGRPVIRGLDGARADRQRRHGQRRCCSLSADHAVSIESFLTDRIKVMKGPLTLQVRRRGD